MVPYSCSAIIAPSTLPRDTSTIMGRQGNSSLSCWADARPKCKGLCPELKNACPPEPSGTDLPWET